MTFEKSPESLLRDVLAKDGDRMTDLAKRWVSEYLGAGECELACEGFISEIMNGHYVPSEAALGLLKAAAKHLKLEFPSRD